MRLITVLTVLTVIVATAASSSASLSSASIGSDPKGDSLFLYNAAAKWFGIDPHKGLDTMKLYVESHPYATEGEGEVLGAISATNAFMKAMMAGLLKNDWIAHYNWLVSIQAKNSDREYQMMTLDVLSETMGFIDYNDAANMWYNYRLVFNDSFNVQYAEKHIADIRKQEKALKMDTTAFHKLVFPLKPVAIIDVNTTQLQPNLSVLSKPNSTTATLSIKIDDRACLSAWLYDGLGAPIKYLLSGVKDPGNYSLPINTKGLEPGMYYVRLEYGARTITKGFKVG
jgi:hypothetical protein